MRSRHLNKSKISRGFGFSGGGKIMYMDSIKSALSKRVPTFPTTIPLSINLFSKLSILPLFSIPQELTKKVCEDTAMSAENTISSYDNAFSSSTGGSFVNHSFGYGLHTYWPSLLYNRVELSAFMNVKGRFRNKRSINSS